MVPAQNKSMAIGIRTQLKNYTKRVSIWIPAGIVALMLVTGILSSLIAPYRLNDFSAVSVLPPSQQHLLGTNNLGQDIFSLLLAGFRTSTIIALSSAILSCSIGVVLAGLAIFFRGWVEQVVMRLTDLLIMIPEIIFILVFATFSGPALANIVVVIAIFSWSKVTRIIKARMDISINSEKVKYTYLMKGGILDLMRKMWSDISPAVSTMFVLQCSKAIIYEADLSLVGISDPSVVTWGRLIRQAIDYGVIYSGNAYLWWLLPPVVCLVILVASLSLLVFKTEVEY
jgi:peptide/nickel transport system permease protein